MRTLFAFLVALSLATGARAQTFTLAQAQQVANLAPQLVAFSGSTGNFESLISGLTAGTPVTLTTLGADGTMQIVTFLPGLAMSAADAARTLETARQSLIARGIATPNAQQLAIALMGGTLTNGGSSAALPGILTGNANTTAIQTRNELVSVSTPGLNTGTNFSGADLQALRASLPPATMASLTATELNQALQLAVGLLAQQGIVDPTADQLRIALLGGTLAIPGGTNTTLQGVLQPRVRNTSESPFLGTSNSPSVGTSNTPSTLNPIVTPAPVNGVAAVRAPRAAPVLNRPGARPGR